MASTDTNEVEGSLNLKTSINNIMHTLFYCNISEFSRPLQKNIDEGTYKTTIKICTSLVGRHNYSSPVMYPCWVMVVVFRNILSFMTDIKNIKCYHVHI